MPGRVASWTMSLCLWVSWAALWHGLSSDTSLCIWAATDVTSSMDKHAHRLCIAGSAAQEVDDVPVPPNLGAWNFSMYENHVHLKLDPFGPGVATSALIYYDCHRTPEYQLSSMVTDMRALCPLNDLLEIAASKFTQPVYRYIVERIPTQRIESENAAMYAFHGVDLYAFFDTLSNFAESTSEKDLQFQKVVKSAVLEFVHSGQIQGWEAVPHGTGLAVRHKGYWKPSQQGQVRLLEGRKALLARVCVDELNRCLDAWVQWLCCTVSCGTAESERNPCYGS